jgi:hypothetical protein
MSDSLLKIKKTAAIISMEASSSGQLLQALPTRLPGFVADVKSFINNIIGGSAPTFGILKKDRQLLKSMKVVSYMNLAETTGYIPAGLKCSYPEYLDQLEKGQVIIDGLMSKVLQPSLRWLAMLMTEPDRLARITRSKEFEAISFHDLEKQKKSMHDCFSQKSAGDKNKLENLIANNGEWESVLDRTLALQDRYSAIDRSKIIEIVTEITTALETLFQRSQLEPDVYKLSGKTMKEMSVVATQLAEEVEHFSVYSFQLQQFTQAIEDTQTVLAKRLA